MTDASTRHTVGGCSDCPFAGLDFPAPLPAIRDDPVHPVICQHPSRGTRHRVRRTLSQLASEGAPDDCPLRARPLLIVIDVDAGRVEPNRPPLVSCAADAEGRCDDPQCPQDRDGEPGATGRLCPLARLEEL